MATVQSGKWSPVEFTNTPKSVHDYLHGFQSTNSVEKFAIQNVQELFALSPTSLTFHGVSVSSAQLGKAIAAEIARSTNLTKLSLSGMGRECCIPILQSLVDNISIEKLCLSNCNLRTEDLQSYIVPIVSWNRSITEWDLSGNTQLGDAGLMAMCNAFVSSASNLERLSFRNCGARSLLCDALRLLSALPSLMQLDVSDNGGYHDPLTMQTLSEVDELLLNNAKLMHPGEKVTHVALYDVNSHSNNNNNNSTLIDFGGSLESPTPPLLTSPQSTNSTKKSLNNDSIVKKNHSFSRKPASPQPHLAASVRQQNTSSLGTSVRRSSFRHESPAVASPIVRRRSVYSPTPRTQQEQPLSLQSSIAFDKTDTQQQPMQHYSSQRSGTPPPAAPSPARSTRTQGSPARTQSIRRAPSSVAAERKYLDDPSEEYVAWQRVKEQYNQFIRDPNRASSPNTSSRSVALAEPKYVLGKLLSSVKDRPSSAFRPSSSPCRPYQDSEHSNGAVSGSVRRGSLNNGEITFLNNDPREIGYVSRKMAAGEVVLKCSGTFRSTTEREVLWGCDPKTQIARRTRSPGPGFYSVESEWEANARRARAAARGTTATGHKVFGSSGAPRAILEQKPSDVPGPGFYEIP